MNKLTVCLAALLVAAPLTWLAGEKHRENCIREDRQACTVLPWDEGRQPQPASGDPLKGWNKCKVYSPGGPCIVPAP